MPCVRIGDIGNETITVPVPDRECETHRLAGDVFHSLSDIGGEVIHRGGDFEGVEIAWDGGDACRHAITNPQDPSKSH